MLLLRQVDDFSVAAPSTTTATHIFDLINDHLAIIFLNRLGLVRLFNELDVTQTWDYYVKILGLTYILHDLDTGSVTNTLTLGWANTT